MKTAITTSLVRHFPQSPVPTRKRLTLDVARNERFSFQVVMRQTGEHPLPVTVSAEMPGAVNVRIRRVGYVPLPHHNTPLMESPLDMDGLGHVPGLVPDPLLEEQEYNLPGRETHAFWITGTPSRAMKPGRARLPVTVTPATGRPQTVVADVTVHDLRLEPRRGFPITHWFYADALIDWYGTDPSDERFWVLLERYFRNMADHGQDTILVPVFTPPLDGVKTPSQLLRVKRTSKDLYAFDWRAVKRYVRLARKCGLKRFEWTHFFTQWGVRHAIRIYEGDGKEEKLLWPADTPATSEVYRRFLGRFLPEFHAFLKDERILRSSYFHVSDEPHGEEHLANYVAARAMLKELAPWMKVMDALSEVMYADKTDMPVASIKTVAQFLEKEVDAWCYYCCEPRKDWLNRLLDTPLPKIAMHGFLFYRWPIRGFLHWGYNYWYKSQTRQRIDPFTVSDGLKWPDWAYGDTFVVYPGPDGPIDSIRWEVFAESLQEYRLLQTLKIDSNDPRLSPLLSFKDFPKHERWRKQLKRRLLTAKK